MPFSSTMLGWNDAGDLRNLSFSISQTLWPRAGKVSAKEYACWQFPSEYLYEEDEVLRFLTSHDPSRRPQHPSTFSTLGIGQLTVGVPSSLC